MSISIHEAMFISKISGIKSKINDIISDATEFQTYVDYAVQLSDGEFADILIKCVKRSGEAVESIGTLLMAAINYIDSARQGFQAVDAMFSGNKTSMSTGSGAGTSSDSGTGASTGGGTGVSDGGETGTSTGSGADASSGVEPGGSGAVEIGTLIGGENGASDGIGIGTVIGEMLVGTETQGNSGN